MAIPVKLTCPLGSTCEEIKDGAIHRCMWYTCLAGQNPQTGEIINDEWKCAITWMPIMMVETSNTNRSTAAATESFRNEYVQRTDVTNQILLTAAQNAQLKMLNNNNEDDR